MLRTFICDICWRILWRLWPDRVYRGYVEGSLVRESALRNIAQAWKDEMGSWIIVTEYLDHAGRLVDNDFA